MKIWTMGEILVEIMRPEPDKPLDAPGTLRGPYPSGAPANFIDTVARLGHPAGIIGGVGNDRFGQCVLSRLERDGVDIRLVRREEYGTTATAFVAYDSDGERSFIFHLSRTPAVSARCPAEHEVRDPAPAFFHVVGCSLLADEGFCAEILRTGELFRKLGAKISFDPNIRPELLYGRRFRDVAEPILAHCSVLLPGLAELYALTGADDVQKAVNQLFANPTLEIIALKLGGDGCRVFTRNDHFALGVYPVTVLDPTGAGDCFDAGFLCGLVDGLPLLDAAKQATAAAALNAAAFGPMEGDISVETVARMIQK